VFSPSFGQNQLSRRISWEPFQFQGTNDISVSLVIIFRRQRWEKQSINAGL
ncbi:hypothetical protein PO909_025441, partial [Leuciscus waleckii]